MDKFDLTHNREKWRAFMMAAMNFSFFHVSKRNFLKYEQLSAFKEELCSMVRQTVPVTGPVVAQRVGRVIALLFHDCGTRRG